MSMQSILSQVPIDLGDNLILRFAEPNDVDAVVDLNTRMFHSGQGARTRDLMSGGHPTTKAGDFTVVEDTGASKIVSTVGLISQTWAYGGVPFKAGRPELVATEEEYQRRGLVRKQFEVIHALSASKGELVCAITGIPWFYRQFGYERALTIRGGYNIPREGIRPRKDNEAEQYQLRPATPDDYAFIQEVYEHASHRQILAGARSQAEWDFEFSGCSKENATYRAWSIIESRTGERLGYIQYVPGSTPWVRQLELKPGMGYLNLMPSLLRELVESVEATLAPDEEVEGLSFDLGGDHPAYRTLPGTAGKPGAWYIRVPNLVAFFLRIRPALEANMSNSVAARYSGELRLNFYRSGLSLAFEDGEITAITNWSPGSTHDGEAGFPDLSFLQLVFGRRRYEELADHYPGDCWANSEARVLLNCLFPRFTGDLWASG